MTNKTLVCVADRAEARFFTKHGPNLRVLQAFAHPDGRLQDHALGTDQPGRSFDRMGPGRHAQQPAHSPSENVTDTFVRALAGALEARRTAHEFDDLVLVADPKFLGRLRAELSSDTLRLISVTIDKDFANLSDHDVATRLATLL
jgi:protein required for attachment to host cells